MKKQKETSEVVWYTCEEEFPIGKDIDKRKRSRIIYERKYGLFE